MADTPSGETAIPEVLENNANPTATPAVNAVDPAEVERLKKEAEQARMRANQLENELKKKAEAETELKQRQLEEQQEYKTLYEQEKAERERLAREREDEARNAEIARERNSVLGEFPEAVREIADETGITLSDTSEEAKQVFKEKLEKISTKLGDTVKVTSNNTNISQKPITREEALKQWRETGNKEYLGAAINELSFVKPFTQQ